MIHQQYGYLGEDEDDNPAKFARLMDEIRNAITAGKYQPGEPLPSISCVQEERGWARATVAHAYRKLMDERLLFYVPGLGYHVSKRARLRAAE